jgi:hypothetical protein
MQIYKICKYTKYANIQNMQIYKICKYTKYANIQITHTPRARRSMILNCKLHI